MKHWIQNPYLRISKFIAKCKQLICQFSDFCIFLLSKSTKFACFTKMHTYGSFQIQIEWFKLENVCFSISHLPTILDFKFCYERSLLCKNTIKFPSLHSVQKKSLRPFQNAHQTSLNASKGKIESTVLYSTGY